MPLNIGAQVWQSWPSALLLCPNPSIRKWQYHEAGQCLLCTRAPWQAEGKFRWWSRGLIQGRGDIWQTCLKKNPKPRVQGWAMPDWSQRKPQQSKHYLAASWSHTKHYVSTEQLPVLQPLCLHRVTNVNFSKQHSWMWWSRAALTHRQNPSWF